MKNHLWLVPAMAGAFVIAAPAGRAADNPAPAAEAAQVDTVKLSIVTAKGGGWGVDKRVRAALEGQPGVKTILLSGLRATVVMQDGQALDEAKVKEKFKANSLELVSLQVVDAKVPKAAYVLQASGTGWATTNDKVRVALEGVKGVTSAFVGSTITLLVDHEQALDKVALAAVLDPLNVKVSGVQKADKPPF